MVQGLSQQGVGQAQGRGQQGAHHPPGLQVYGGAGAGDGQYKTALFVEHPWLQKVCKR